MEISPELKRTFELMLKEATGRRHTILTTDHGFYILLTHTYRPVYLLVDSKIIDDFERRVSQILEELRHYLDNFIESSQRNVHPVESPALKRALRNMQRIAREMGEEVVRPVHFFLALLQEENYFKQLLIKHGIDPSILENQIKEAELEGNIEREWGEPEEQNSGNEVEVEPEEETPLHKYTTELVSQADKFDELIGREAELERLIQILARRKKNNPVLVGEAGVGKSAIVEGLAKRIARGEVPDFLKNKKIYALDVSSLIAGTKYRGDFEVRMKELLKELKKEDQPILFIDEIHTIIGTGATGNSSLDIANILKPALARGELRCIGATTYSEYKDHIEKDKALQRRFQKLDIREPSIAESYQILKGLKKRYEEFHGVKYSDEALKSAVNLAKKFLTEKFLPDSAIDLIDEAGARFRLKGKKTITKREIGEVVSMMANVPREVAGKGEVEQLKGLENRLKKVVIGQDKAVEAVVKVIKRNRAGLARENKPVGSFLFVGPTGVGKTELAKQIAQQLGIHFIRFDMSEYQEKHAVAKLIGAPPGYVGYEKGGLLVEEIRKHPHAVLLLDEIEKAHPDIVQILLQVMDNGTLTDNDGRRADFKNVLLIMTSNLGVGEGGSIGFGKEMGDFKEDAIEQFFAPEFLNRLDGVIRFKPLGEKVVLQIVDKFIEELRQKLRKRKVTLRLTDRAKRQLGAEGFSPKFGARPLSRKIEERIVEPITEELLFGKLQQGGVVEVDYKRGKFQFKIGKGEKKRSGKTTSSPTGKGKKRGKNSRTKGGKETPSPAEAELDG
ncbi:MAG: ATP-dependent Clp protease ATP-binding subunit ClpA [Epsilonproteobacteria bacterium]|jgi:ATP-dependent Clp protease ATP-binding subunit ClpA|nr:ATP-dependent Clp protease ATP-binding subunit ClpA [Campylobacterota bacterium]NPA88895.1 AAA domain-containing protein [Campylobacterota bacterium]